MEFHAWASLFCFVRPRMDRDTMRSITDWSLWASVHHEPVPSQVTAAGSCAQVTRPGTTPRGTPNGESVGSNRKEPMVLAAAIERANCRRVISILSYSSVDESCVPSASVNGSRHAVISCLPLLLANILKAHGIFSS